MRGLAGQDYDTGDEAALATIRPAPPRPFSADFALPAPGNAAIYNVHVILTTGNERGSNAVTVPHPA